MAKTTINGRVVRALERHTVTAGDDRLELIEGRHEEWPIGSDVTVSFPEERIDGRVTAVIEGEERTELRTATRDFGS